MLSMGAKREKAFTPSGVTGHDPLTAGSQGHPRLPCDRKWDFFNRSPWKEPLKRVWYCSHHGIKHIKWASITSKGTVNSIQVGWVRGPGREGLRFWTASKSPSETIIKNDIFGVWRRITDLLATAPSPAMQSNFLFLPSIFTVDEITIRLSAYFFLSTKRCVTTPTLANSFHPNPA